MGKTYKIKIAGYAYDCEVCGCSKFVPSETEGFHKCSSCGTVYCGDRVARQKIANPKASKKEREDEKVHRCPVCGHELFTLKSHRWCAKCNATVDWDGRVTVRKEVPTNDAE